MRDFDATSSMSFLKGYREQSQRNRPNISALDVLDLFSLLDLNSLSVVEIASQLMISQGEAFRCIEELKRRGLVSVKRNVNVGLVKYPVWS